MSRCVRRRDTGSRDKQGEMLCVEMLEDMRLEEKMFKENGDVSHDRRN